MRVKVGKPLKVPHLLSDAARDLLLSNARICSVLVSAQRRLQADIRHAESVWPNQSSRVMKSEFHNGLGEKLVREVNVKIHESMSFINDGSSESNIHFYR